MAVVTLVELGLVSMMAMVKAGCMVSRVHRSRSTTVRRGRRSKTFWTIGIVKARSVRGDRSIKAVFFGLVFCRPQSTLIKILTEIHLRQIQSESGTRQFVVQQISRSLFGEI